MADTAAPDRENGSARRAGQDPMNVDYNEKTTNNVDLAANRVLTRFEYVRFN